MMYPKIKIDLKKIEHNVKTIIDLCNKYNIKVAGVTKVFCGHPKITQAYIDGGVSYLADSRTENLAKFKDFSLPKMLLRLPMLSEVGKVVEYADISLNSEVETIKALSEKASAIGKVHKVILMVDLGDLREGYYEEEELYNGVKEVLSLEGVEIVGVGTNLTCYGGVIPEESNLKKLIKIAKTIEEKYNIKMEIISGGNSSNLHLLLAGKRIPGMNNLRLGESLVLGLETAYGNRIHNTYDDAFKLIAEIIEVKEKPSVPTGKIGRDAFGKVPIFKDRGIRKRMICGIGRQDVEPDSLTPIDDGITILGASSDHLILDGTDSNMDYKVGDKIEFKLTYGGILGAMTSKYVTKDLE
ncbi:MAG: alanine/ornithine racemase family PLP-dependent enzyme [Tissierellia bacterium]|nr:alanine/ornithine racemase family PLP-dependent enzyme [Tissierellia bacterium]